MSNLTKHRLQTLSGIISEQVDLPTDQSTKLDNGLGEMGYYWHLPENDSKWTIAFYNGDPTDRYCLELLGSDEIFGLKDLPGKFVGPIEAPGPIDTR